MKRTAIHEVELNFYYLHYNDCMKFVEWANQEQSTLKSLYARHAILSAVFASEALINRVLHDFYLPAQGFASIERLNTFEKWYSAPLLCGKTSSSQKTFDSSKPPFQSFVELVKIRNWLVHPKVGRYIEARKDPNSTISVLNKGIEIPWIDTLEGGIWGITRIPLNPFELDGRHAQKALVILEAMVSKLKELMSDTITDDWLFEIELRDKGRQVIEKINTLSLWGGYTPDIKKDD